MGARGTDWATGAPAENAEGAMNNEPPVAKAMGGRQLTINNERKNSLLIRITLSLWVLYHIFGEGVNS
jgi:hypothetical protein